MTRHRCLGAIGFPAFLLAWASGVAGVLLELMPAGPLQAPDVPVPSWQQPLAAVPSLEDSAAWREALSGLVQQSDVMNGSWQPDVGAGDAMPPPPLPQSNVPITSAEPAKPLRRPAVALRLEPLPAPATQGRTDVADADAHEQRRVDVAPVHAPLQKRPATVGSAVAFDKSEARLDLRHGRFREAYRRLRPQIAQGRHDSEFLGLLAVAALRIGEPVEALVIYQRLTAREPDSGRWQAGLALAREQLGFDADELYRQALANSASGRLHDALQTKLCGGCSASGPAPGTG